MLLFYIYSDTLKKLNLSNTHNNKFYFRNHFPKLQQLIIQKQQINDFINSDSDEDDYYVKFIGKNGADGDGIWEECAKPGAEVEYDKTTLPIQLARQTDGSFVLDHIDWDKCKSGGTTPDGTNPRASFVGITVIKL